MNRVAARIDGYFQYCILSGGGIAQLEASNSVLCFTWSVHKIPFFCL